MSAFYHEHLLYGTTFLTTHKKTATKATVFKWRRGRDSNPRYREVHTLSRRALSTTQTPLQIEGRTLHKGAKKGNHYTAHRDAIRLTPPNKSHFNDSHLKKSHTRKVISTQLPPAHCSGSTSLYT
jgi:hypothetical protein